MSEIVNINFGLYKEIGGLPTPPGDNRWMMIVVIIVIGIALYFIFFSPIGENEQAKGKPDKPAIQAPRHAPRPIN